MAQINPKKIIKAAFFILGLLLLLLLISRVGFQEIVKIIAKAKIDFLIYGFSIYLILILIRAWKWLLLIKTAGNKIEFGQFLPFYFVNCLVGNITPFKSGEAAAPFLFKKYLKIPIGQGFSVIILDRFFELTAFTAIFALTIWYIIPILQWALIGLLVFISFLITVLVSQKISLKILGLFNFLKRYSLAKKVLEFIAKELNLFYDSLSLFKNKRVYRFIIPLTIICWIFELLSFYFIIASVLPVSLFHAVAAQIVAIAAGLLTFIPVGIGIGEVGIVYVLSLFNYPAVLSTAGALLARLIITGTLFTVGIIGTFLLKEKDG